MVTPHTKPLGILKDFRVWAEALLGQHEYRAEPASGSFPHSTYFLGT